MNGCHIKPEQFFNLIFGYYDRYIEVTSATSVGAGTTYVYGTAVPAGEVWIITALNAYHQDTPAREVKCGIYNGTTYGEIVHALSLATWVRVYAVGTHVLKAGDKVYVACASLASGKIVWVQVVGYKMKVA